MTCRELVDFLGAWLDGELPAATRAAFEEHLAHCPSCVAYLATYRRTVALAREARDADTAALELPEELVAAILAAREG